jgi:hypothetical protein
MAAYAAQPLTVVELFTSEGCSSCPPAEAFLTDLARRADVLPLSFHVTYWDYLGWKDPYSLPLATSRQRDYAGLLGDNQVYTPEMVVNGTAGFVGSDRERGLQEISRAQPANAVPLRLTRDPSGLSIAVGAGAGHAQLLLVGFDPEHETRVGRGENGGRILHESNIVRSLTALGAWSGLPLTLRQPPPEGEQYALLLQSDDGKILAAARLTDRPNPS